MKKSIARITVYVAIAAILASLLLTSCSRYIVDRSAGGACGVWFPRVFNPDKAGYGENPRGAAGWGDRWK